MAFCSTARPEKRMSCHVPVAAFWDPGAWSSSCDICRPFTGRLSTSRWLKFTPMRAELMSSTGAVPVTVTSSCMPAGLSSKSSTSSWPTASAIDVYSIAPKPDLSVLMA